MAEAREALRLDPNYAEAHGNLGNALYNKGDWDGALAEYREVLRVNPMMTWRTSPSASRCRTRATRT